MSVAENTVKNDTAINDDSNDWEIVDASNCKKDDGEACCSMDGQDNNGTDATKAATLFLAIDSFSKMNDTIYSDPVEINGLQWQIMIMPRKHIIAGKGVENCLGYFIKCSSKNESKEWSCLASAELRICSQSSQKPHFTRMTSHTYTNRENDWGYSCCMSWADITDESQGYTKDDTVNFEAVITVDSPQFKGEADTLEVD